MKLNFFISFLSKILLFIKIVVLSFVFSITFGVIVWFYLLYTTSLIVLAILDNAASALYFRGFWNSAFLTMLFVLSLKFTGRIFLSSDKD